MTIDTTPPSPSTSATTLVVAGDNVVSGAEQVSASTPVSGTVTGDFAAGDVVTVSVNNQNYTTTVNADGTWTANVLGSDLVADADKSLSVSVAVHDAAGNVGSINNSQAYSVSSVATATITGVLDDEDLDGISGNGITDAAGLSFDENIVKGLRKQTH